MGMVTGSGNSAVHQLFSYDSSGNVVSVDYSSNGGSTFTTYYYLRNAQNDIVKIIDGNGATVVEYKYDSWGKVLSTTGSMASTLGTNQPFRYRGYVYDTETGWYYLQSRYYDPSFARFISADVYLSTGQGVLGHNSYAYCLNNPVNMSDPTGCLPNPLHRPVMVDDGGSYSNCANSESLLYQINANIVIKEKDEAQLVLYKCTEEVLDLIRITDLDTACDVITRMVFAAYYAKHEEDFFASQAQISREIKEHIEGYFWSIGVDGYECPFAFVAYYVLDQNINALFGGKSEMLAFIERKCKTVEMCLDSWAENIYFYGIWER